MPAWKYIILVCSWDSAVLTWCSSNNYFYKGNTWLNVRYSQVTRQTRNHWWASWYPTTAVTSALPHSFLMSCLVCSLFHTISAIPPFPVSHSSTHPRDLSNHLQAVLYMIERNERLQCYNRIGKGGKGMLLPSPKHEWNPDSGRPLQKQDPKVTW